MSGGSSALSGWSCLANVVTRGGTAAESESWAEKRRQDEDSRRDNVLSGSIDAINSAQYNGEAVGETNPR